jgi:hypothetical protein
MALAAAQVWVVPGTGIEPVRPLFTKRRILSPLCLPISPPRPGIDCQTKKPPYYRRPQTSKNRCFRVAKLKPCNGGAAQSRTGLAGFAIRYITALLPRHDLSAVTTSLPPGRYTRGPNKKGQHSEVLPSELEREKSLELSTSTLARLRSTN